MRFPYLILIVILSTLFSVQAFDVPDVLPRPDNKAINTKKPIKVFILSGQSNMVGFGNVPKSLTPLVREKKMFQNLVDEKGRWVSRKDVQYIYNLSNPKKARDLSIKSNRKDYIGPELQFGHYMGYIHDELVLVIKACNGNRCLAYDVLPPSQRKGKFSDPTWRIGCEYDKWFRQYCKQTLKNIGEIYPDYQGQGYQIAGFGWWQGHKDINNSEWNRDYEQNLVALIKDLRKDFDAPNAPFVVSTIAFGGKKMAGKALSIHQAQMAVSDAKKYPEFKDNVASVDCRPFYRGGSHHYGSNAETYMLVGEGMGKAMAKLIKGLPNGGASKIKGLQEEKTVDTKTIKAKAPDLKKPLKIYLMSGQSNMVGFGAISNNTNTNLTYLVHNAKKYQHLSDGKDGWSKRNDVFYINAISGKDVKSDYLKVDPENRFFGPELQFGHQMGNHHDEAVVLLKVSQGNRSLGFDVMPPSSRVGFSKEGEFYKGWQYDIFVADAHKILNNLKDYYPDYQGQGYEIVGFCWWQGHKDQGISQRFYEKHLVNLIKDFRKEFKAPKMKAVVATVAFGGKREMSNKNYQIFKAQMAVNDYEKYPEFKGNVASVDTRDYFRGGAAHYGSHAETYYYVGDGLGRYMVKLLNNEEIIYKKPSKFKMNKRKKVFGPAPNQKKPMKVYILMGQSNMVGMGDIVGKGNKDAFGSLEYIIKKENKYTHLMDKDGNWVIRNDVYFVDLTNGREAECLTIAKNRRYGVETQFGHLLGEHHDEAVLIIKAAQGNRSISHDITPPSSRSSKAKIGTYYQGWQYDIFVGNIRKTLDNLQEYYPQYQNQGYEVAGFCWWQGHKDKGIPTEIYENHLVNLIKDLRKEFDAPKALFSIASVGFGGQDMHPGHLMTLKAQMNVSDYKKYPEFKNNVMTHDIRDFWRPVNKSPRSEGHHYNRNCETYSLVADVLGKNMIKMLKNKKTKKK